MASNRRRDGGAGFARACKAALMCSLLAAAGIVYVRQTMEQDRLGRLVTDQENRSTELREEYRRQTAIRSMLSSPEAIQERVRQHRLNLTLATPQQRLYISVPYTPPGTTPLAIVPASGPALRRPAETAGTFVVASSSRSIIPMVR
jgi:hypothetical protein